MVGVEKHLPNMASSQVIKPPAFKSPSRAPGNNCSFLCLSSKVGGGGGGEGSNMTIEISRVVISVGGLLHTCLWIASATGLSLGSAF